MARAERAAGGRNSALFGGKGDVTPGPPFIASYDGECSAGDEIHEGDTIRADGEGGWIHIDCEDS
jgi:hypothetical protein